MISYLRAQFYRDVHKAIYYILAALGIAAVVLAFFLSKSSDFSRGIYYHTVSELIRGLAVIIAVMLVSLVYKKPLHMKNYLQKGMRRDNIPVGDLLSAILHAIVLAAIWLGVTYAVSMVLPAHVAGEMERGCIDFMTLVRQTGFSLLVVAAICSGTFLLAGIRDSLAFGISMSFMLYQILPQIIILLSKSDKWFGAVSRAFNDISPMVYMAQYFNGIAFDSWAKFGMCFGLHIVVLTVMLMIWNRRKIY